MAHPLGKLILLANFYPNTFPFSEKAGQESLEFFIDKSTCPITCPYKNKKSQQIDLQ